MGFTAAVVLKSAGRVRYRPSRLKKAMKLSLTRPGNGCLCRPQLIFKILIKGFAMLLLSLFCWYPHVLFSDAL